MADEPSAGDKFRGGASGAGGCDRVIGLRAGEFVFGEGGAREDSAAEPGAGPGARGLEIGGLVGIQQLQESTSPAVSRDVSPSGSGKAGKDPSLLSRNSIH